MKPKDLKTVILDDAVHDSLAELRHNQFKHEVYIGFDALDREEFSDKTIEEIAADSISEFKQRSTK